MYGNVEQAKELTGMRPVNLGMEDETALDDAIMTWLEAATDYIKRSRGRDFEEEEGGVPDGINLIANRIAANIGMMCVVRRQTPVVRVDEFAIRMADPQVLTEDIMHDLSLYGRKLKDFFIRRVGDSDAD